MAGLLLFPLFLPPSLPPSDLSFQAGANNVVYLLAEKTVKLVNKIIVLLLDHNKNNFIIN
jgi:lipopolysaccharide export system protein LptA